MMRPVLAPPGLLRTYFNMKEEIKQETPVIQLKNKQT